MHRHLADSRSGGELISYPVGYVIISRPDDNSIYLEEIFVNPDVRSKGWVFWMASQIEQLGHKEGRSYMYGDLSPSCPNNELMDRLMVKFGMRKLYTTPVLDIYRKVI